MREKTVDSITETNSLDSSVMLGEDARSFAKILELGQADVEGGCYRDIDEFFADLDSEQSDEHRWR
jgi:hypothetical protein